MKPVNLWFINVNTYPHSNANTVIVVQHKKNYAILMCLGKINCQDTGMSVEHGIASYK